MIPITDHVDQALNRLITQYKTNCTNLQNTISSFVEQTQDDEDMFQEFFAERYLTTAIGAQLDGLGLIIGVNRGILNDTDYRARLYLKIFQNYSEGTIENLLRIYNELMNPDSMIFTEIFPAEFSMMAINPDPITDLTTVYNSIVLAKAAGVGISFLAYTNGEPFFAFLDDTVGNNSGFNGTLYPFLYPGYFMSTGSEINYGNHSRYDIGSNDATISFHIKNNSPTLDKALFQRGVPGSSGFFVQTFQNDILIYHGANWVLRTNGGLSTEYTHYAFRKIGSGKWQVFKNGIELGYNFAVNSNPSLGSNTVLLNNVLYAFDGNVSNFIWHDRALTIDEIKSLRDGINVSTNQILWIKANETSGVDSIDYSPSGNNGVMTNVGFGSLTDYGGIFTSLI